MANRMYGYVRVSRIEQNEARQMMAMEDFGVPGENICVDRQSGKDFDRPGYRRLIKKLKKDDILVVKSIDRLGRDYSEILDQWRYITRELEAAVVVIDMPLLDTRNSRDLTGTLIADIVLELLSYVAQKEREYISQRTIEGLAAAKRQGKRLGRTPLPIPDAFEELFEQWQRGEISANRAAKLLGVSRMTFVKWRDMRMSKEC